MFVYIALLKVVQLPVHWRRSWSKRRPMSCSPLRLRQTPRKSKETSASLQTFHCLLHLQTLTFPAQHPWKAMGRISLKICPQTTSMSFKSTETPQIRVCICSTSTSLTDCYRKLQKTEDESASPNGVRTEDAGASETADISEFTRASLYICGWHITLFCIITQLPVRMFFVLSVYLDCFPFGSFFECKRCLEHFRLKSKCSDILFLVRACHVPERPVARDPHLVVWIITTTHYRLQEGCYWQQNNSNFGDVLDYLLDPGFLKQLNNYRN